MRVLWLCNTMLPVIAEDLGLQPSNKEGWLSGLSNRMLARKGENSIELGVCFPYQGPMSLEEPVPLLKGSVNDIPYYGFKEDIVHEEIYDKRLEVYLGAIIHDFQPDLIHIFGTEYAHSLAMVRSFSHPDKILIGMQGVCSACAREYMADLPSSIQKRVTFRDWVRKDSIVKQQEKFIIRAMHEEKALMGVSHITGRTRLDREETFQINPEAKYHFMNETLRSNFYTETWNIEHCKKHSILLSQGNYPLKGAHYLLEAVALVKVQYPDCTVKIAGDKITSKETIKDKCKLSSYGKYLLELIDHYHLQNVVTFLGRQNANEMKEEFLKSHVYVCASSIENSPNSLGEAMLLGMPVVSSNVGGIPDLIEDQKEGLLFEKGNIKELANCICEIFRNEEKAIELGRNGKKRATVTHDSITNYNRLVEIYEEILKNK